MKKIMCFVVAAMAISIIGCKQTPKQATAADEVAWYENDSALQAQLAAAIEDAKALDSSKIVNNLMPIQKGYPGEEWATFDGHDMVLVVTLVDSSRLQRFFGRDDLYRIEREMGTWVSLPIDWANRRAAFEGLDSIGAHMRLIQMYGLDPTCDYDIMVSFYADPAGIFRPAHDPAINTTSAGLEFPAYADEAGTMLNYDGLDLEENTVAKMTADISGYRRYKQSQVLTSGIVEYDFGTLTDVLKGLKAKAMFSYDYHLNNNTIYRKQYYQYAYDPATQTYKQKLYASSAPSNLRREHYDTQQFLLQYTLSYNRDFGPHSIAAVVGMETQRRTGDNFYAMRNLAFSSPYLFNGVEEGQIANSATGGIYSANYNAFIGRLNYSFAQRYLIEGQFRYDGSSKFAKGHRWGFFPSVSLGWVVSEEPWFKKIGFLKGIDQLKLRASYGEMGDDSGANYDWVAGYTYPSTSGNSEKGYYNQYTPGFIFGSQFVYAATPMAIPNELISWYKAKTFNVGVDFDTNNKLFGFSLDYFSRKMTGLYEYRTSEFPTVIGANPPRENANSSRNFGMELELRHHNRIGRDFVYNVKGIVTITRQKYLTAIQNGPYANAYDQWRNDHLNNRYQGVQFGYEGNGRYQNWDEIWNETLYHEKDLLPGDYKYLDWNGDGEINSQDEHPYAFDQTPWMNYSLSFDCAYKGFDFSMLWQGSALGSMSYEEPLYSIWGQNGGGALEQYWDRWHPADENADPYDPNIEWVKGYYAYTGHYPSANSTFNRVSTAYLRLKQIELGYTLPKWKAFPSLNLRVYANAYNLFTITGVKFVDPEHPSDDLGRLYPLNRTYTFGVQVSF